MAEPKIPDLKKGGPQKQNGRYSRVWLRLLAKKLGIVQFCKDINAFYANCDRYDNQNPGGTIDMEMPTMYEELVAAQESKNWPDWLLNRGRSQADQGSHSQAQDKQPSAAHADKATAKPEDGRSMVVGDMSEDTATRASREQRPPSRVTKASARQPTATSTNETDNSQQSALAQASSVSKDLLIGDRQAKIPQGHQQDDSAAPGNGHRLKRKHVPTSKEELLPHKKVGVLKPEVEVAQSHDDDVDVNMGELDVTNSPTQNGPMVSSAAPALSKDLFQSQNLSMLPVPSSLIKQAMANISMLYPHLQQKPLLRTEIREQLLRGQTIWMKHSIQNSINPNILVIGQDLVQDIMSRENLTRGHVLNLLQGLSKFERVTPHQPSTGGSQLDLLTAANVAGTGESDARLTNSSGSSVPKAATPGASVQIATGNKRPDTSMQDEQKNGVAAATTESIYEVTKNHRKWPTRYYRTEQGTKRFYGRGLPLDYDNVPGDDSLGVHLMSAREQIDCYDRMEARRAQETAEGDRKPKSDWRTIFLPRSTR